MQLNAIDFLTPSTTPVDQWAIDTAKRMKADGYPAGSIIDYLLAYGIGHSAACSLAREH